MMTQKEIMITMNQMNANARIKAHTHEAVPTGLLTRIGGILLGLVNALTDAPGGFDPAANATL